MKFIDPSYKETKEILYNNNELIKFLEKNGALLKTKDVLDSYTDITTEDAKIVATVENKNTIEALAKLLTDNSVKIKKYSVKSLVGSRFLEDEIKEALGFDESIKLSSSILQQIYYTYKYCYVSSFFQNNWENFIPQFDYEEMEENDAAMAYMDAITKEFDKLDGIITDSKDFNSYEDIPYEYINHLTQLLGLEKSTFLIYEGQEEQYRTLAENILDVYAQKGTPASFELLFNFLGYDITATEYYFDRRKYYSDETPELADGDVTRDNYIYYLTKYNPSENCNVPNKEIVTEADMTEPYNLENFNDLVEKYGVGCVLGYETLYEVSSNTFPKTTSVKEYSGDVYKFFKSNYLVLTPKVKYIESNFTEDQYYQLPKIVEFLLPCFYKKHLNIIINANQEENVIFNLSRGPFEQFYMLDSEDYSSEFAENFTYNYNTYKVLNGQRLRIYRIVDQKYDGSNTTSTTSNLKLYDYQNSLGMSGRFLSSDGTSEANVFMMPVGDKIKILNTTKYWGSKIVDPTQEYTGENAVKVYPCYRKDLNYTDSDGVEHKTYFGETNSTGDTMYSNDGDRYWNTYVQTDLNGCIDGKSTVKNTIKNLNPKIKIDYYVNGIQNLNEEITTSSVKTMNYCWKYIKTLTDISSFVKNHNNVINYDYINDKLMEANDLGLNSTGNITTGNSTVDAIINKINNEGNYIITNAASTETGYYVYQNIMYRTYQSKSEKNYMNRFRPIPDENAKDTTLEYSTFKDLLATISGNTQTSSEKGSVEMVSNLTMSWTVKGDEKLYRPKLVPDLTSYIIKKDGSVIKLALNNSMGIPTGVGNVYTTFDQTQEETLVNDKTYEEALLIREPTLNKIVVSNYKKGSTIYDTSTEKLYQVIMGGYYISEDGIFGIKEISYVGKIEYSDDDDCYYNYAYDEYYHGISEEEDNDNYILKNISKAVYISDIDEDTASPVNYKNNAYKRPSVADVLELLSSSSIKEKLIKYICEKWESIVPSLFLIKYGEKTYSSIQLLVSAKIKDYGVDNSTNLGNIVINYLNATDAETKANYKKIIDLMSACFEAYLNTRVLNSEDTYSKIKNTFGVKANGNICCRGTYMSGSKIRIVPEINKDNSGDLSIKLNPDIVNDDGTIEPTKDVITISKHVVSGDFYDFWNDVEDPIENSKNFVLLENNIDFNNQYTSDLIPIINMLDVIDNSDSLDIFLRKYLYEELIKRWRTCTLGDESYISINNVNYVRIINKLCETIKGGTYLYNIGSDPDQYKDNRMHFDGIYYSKDGGVDGKMYFTVDPDDDINKTQYSTEKDKLLDKEYNEGLILLHYIKESSANMFAYADVGVEQNVISVVNYFGKNGFLSTRQKMYAGYSETKILNMFRGFKPHFTSVDSYTKLGTNHTYLTEVQKGMVINKITIYKASKDSIKFKFYTSFNYSDHPKDEKGSDGNYVSIDSNPFSGTGYISFGNVKTDIIDDKYANPYNNAAVESDGNNNSKWFFSLMDDREFRIAQNFEFPINEWNKRISITVSDDDYVIPTFTFGESTKEEYKNNFCKRFNNGDIVTTVKLSETEVEEEIVNESGNKETIKVTKIITDIINKYCVVKTYVEDNVWKVILRKM